MDIIPAKINPAKNITAKNFFKRIVKLLRVGIYFYLLFLIGLISIGIGREEVFGQAASCEVTKLLIIASTDKIKIFFTQIQDI